MHTALFKSRLQFSASPAADTHAHADLPSTSTSTSTVSICTVCLTSSDFCIIIFLSFVKPGALLPVHASMFVIGQMLLMALFHVNVLEARLIIESISTVTSVTA